eukprot:RCo048575
MSGESPPGGVPSAPPGDRIPSGSAPRCESSGSPIAGPPADAALTPRRLGSALGRQLHSALPPGLLPFPPSNKDSWEDALTTPAVLDFITSSGDETLLGYGLELLSRPAARGTDGILPVSPLSATSRAPVHSIQESLARVLACVVERLASDPSIRPLHSQLGAAVAVLEDPGILPKDPRLAATLPHLGLALLAQQGPAQGWAESPAFPFASTALRMLTLAAGSSEVQPPQGQADARPTGWRSSVLGEVVRRWIPASAKAMRTTSLKDQATAILDLELRLLRALSRCCAEEETRPLLPALLPALVAVLPRSTDGSRESLDLATAVLSVLLFVMEKPPNELQAWVASLVGVTLGLLLSTWTLFQNAEDELATLMEGSLSASAASEGSGAVMELHLQRIGRVLADGLGLLRGLCALSAEAR